MDSFNKLLHFILHFSVELIKAMYLKINYGQKDQCQIILLI